MTILSVKDYELIQLLNIIYCEDAISSELLATKMNISCSRVRSLVSSLNEIISPNAIYYKNKATFLYIHQNSSYDYCISKILSQSLECSIVEYIFFEKHKTYNSLAESLHVSESTIKRVINQLNIYFLKYDISIRSRPLRFVGSERCIRYFFILYFTSKYNLSNIPFKDNNKLWIGQLYDFVGQMFRKKTSIQDLSNFSLFVLVSYERELNGHNLSLTNSLKVKFLIDILNSLPEKITKMYKMNSKPELNFWINACSLFTNGETLILSPLNFKKQEKIYKDSGITEFLNLFCKIFRLKITDEVRISMSREIYEILFGFLRPRNSMQPLNNYYYIFYENNNFFMDSYKKLTKELFYQCFSNKFYAYFEFVFFVLTTNFSNLHDNLFSLFASINITIYTDFDFQFSNYVKNKIDKTIPGNYNFSLVDTKEKLYDPDLIDKTDLFITNIYNTEDIGYPLKKTYMISRHISKNDMNYLTKMISDVYKTNYQDIISEGRNILKLHRKEN